MKYANVWHCAYRIVAEEGMASFWRGSLCSFAKVRLQSGPPLSMLLD